MSYVIKTVFEKDHAVVYTEPFENEKEAKEWADLLNTFGYQSSVERYDPETQQDNFGISAENSNY